jgi:hypothetical protein
VSILPGVIEPLLKILKGILLIPGAGLVMLLIFWYLLGFLWYSRNKRSLTQRTAAKLNKHRLLVDESLSNTPGVGQSAWGVTTPAASRTLVGGVFSAANGREGEGSQQRGDAIEELRCKLEQVHARRMWLQANLQASGALRTRGSA